MMRREQFLGAADAEGRDQGQQIVDRELDPVALQMIDRTDVLALEQAAIDQQRPAGVDPQPVAAAGDALGSAVVEDAR